MEILKGMVRDPGYPDVECTYLKTDDGKLYYFIKDGKLSNGNIIANSVLKEAIGHAPYTSLGLITPTGDVLIPFENKTIKTISDSLLLVEKNTPTTESVVNALKDKSDPFAATNLINAATTIKEQLKSVMGLNGDFIFDNQFSEAAIYTFDGINVGGNYFSFIGENAGSYYMSGNEVGKSIIKYDPNAVYEDEKDTNDASSSSEFSENSNTEEAASTNNNSTNKEEVEQNATDPSPATGEGEIPQENTELPAMPNINIPLEQQFNDTNMNNSSLESDVENTSDNTSSSDDTSSFESNEDKEEPEENQDVSQENARETDLENTEEEENTQVENNEKELEGVENNQDSVTEEVDNTKLNIENDISNDALETDDNQDETEVSNDTSNDEAINDSEKSYENNDNDNEAVEDEEVDEGTTFNYANYQDDQFTNPVIIDATNTIRKLLEENRKQRQIIDRQEGEIETLNSSNDILKEDNDSKSKEIISLRKSMSRYRNQNTNLTRENSRLKSTANRQKEIIDNLKTQNTTLKEQVAGISALGNAVKEASTVINNHHEDSEKEADEYDSDLEYGYLDGALDETFQKTKIA